MIWASPLSIPPSPPRCTSPTSPTPPSIAQLLCNGNVVPHAPPPFISSEPCVRTEPLSDPPHGVLGSPDPAPDRVGPSQPPLNFVDGNGYIVLRGLVEARDCEVGWNKVMKAWGSGDEKVVAKNFELLFNAARSAERASAASVAGVPGAHTPIRETTRPSMVRFATYLTASPTYSSVDHPHPRTSSSPGTDSCIGCLLRWTVPRGMRPRTSIARLVALPAPTNYLVGGY